MMHDADDDGMLTTELGRMASLVEMVKEHVPAAERQRMLQIPRFPPPSSPVNHPFQGVPSGMNFPSTRRPIAVSG